MKTKLKEIWEAFLSPILYMFKVIRNIKIACLALVGYAVYMFLVYWGIKWIIWLVTVGISYALGWVEMTPWKFEHAGMVALVATMYLTAVVTKEYFVKWFFVSVPGFAGVLSVNMFTGAEKKKYHKYSTGLHMKWPWEQVLPEFCFSLELVTISFLEDYVTSDNANAVVKASFRYAPSFERLETYAAVDEKTIVVAVLNVARGDLTVEMSKRSAKMARKQTPAIKQSIEQKYRDKTDDLEKNLGIDFEDFTFADIGYSANTQKAMDAAFTNKILFERTGKDPAAQDRMLMLMDKTTRHITEVKIEGGGELSGAIKDMMATPESRAFALTLAAALGSSKPQAQGQKPNEPKPSK